MKGDDAGAIRCGERGCPGSLGRGRLPADHTCALGRDLYSAAGKSEPLSRVPIVVIIRTDHTGRIDLAVSGPIKGRPGLVMLLDAAKRIAQESYDGTGPTLSGDLDGEPGPPRL